ERPARRAEDPLQHERRQEILAVDARKPETDRRERIDQRRVAPDHRALQRLEMRDLVRRNRMRRNGVEPRADLRQRLIRIDVAGDDQHGVALYASSSTSRKKSAPGSD